MTNHYCVLALFDYPCGVDYESESSTQLNKYRCLNNVLYERWKVEQCCFAHCLAF